MRLFRSHISIFSRTLQLCLLGLVVSVLFAGCKPPQFVSSRYDNFTAYYNTFYNARQVFDKGYKALTQAQAPIDRVRYLPIYQRTSGSGSREFDSAVLKSADLLRNHPDSKWVDDALLLIGKSYFYQENFVGATQKFREVIDLNSSLQDEAVFWLARSLITSGALDEAEKEILFALAKEDVNKKWSSQFGLLMAELKIKLSSWKEASDYLSSSLGEVKDKMIAGRAQFLLGQVLEQQGRYEEAIAAYEGVNKFTPPYELQYAAGFSAVRVQGKHLDAEKALAKLKKMERDDKNFSNLAELQLLRARIWQDNGRDSESFDIYHQLLYDANPIGNAASLKGRIHYALGELYRDVDKDFVMAAAHFDTASASLETSTGARSRIRSSSYSATQIQYAPEAITDANQLKTSYLKFAGVFKEIARFDSLLWLGLMPEDEFQAKILEIRKQRAAEQAEKQRLLAERQRAQSFENGAVAADVNSNYGLPPGKIVPGINDTEGVYDGYLFHKNPVRLQEGRTKFDMTWGKRALAPNWRRSSVLVATSATQEAEDDPATKEDDEVVDEGALPAVSTTDVPRDSTSQATMYTARANSRYELGNTLFLSMVLPDSAAVWYRTVIEEDATQKVAQRAFYALAEVQRALGDNDSANRLYRDILDKYPDSDFSDDVRARLGLDPIERAESDSTILAIQAYENAYMFASEASPEEAINRYLEVASDWVKYEQSGQALLGAATVHMVWAAADSAKIFSALPVTVSFDRMHELWPIKYAWVEPDSVLIAEEVLAPVVLPAPADSGDNQPIDANRPDSIGVKSDSVNVISPIEEAAPDSVKVITPPVANPSENQPPPPVLAPPVDKPLVEAAPPDTTTSGAAATPVAITPAATPVAVISGAVTPAAATPVATKAPEYRVVEGYERRDPLFVEDIFTKVANDYRGKALGLAAERTRKALVEMRTPPPDTTKIVAPMPDLAGGGVPPDSMRVPGADSLGVGNILEGNELAGNELAGNELAGNELEGNQLATEGLVAQGDSSLNMNDLANLPNSDGIRDSTGVLMVPTAGSPGALGANPISEALPPSPPALEQALPQEDVFNSEDEAVGAVRSSSNLKPLLPTGRPNLEAVGWTVMLGNHITMEAAQADLQKQSAQLGGARLPIYLITNAEGDRLEFIVGWGLFGSKELADEAIVKYDAFLPPRRNHLHLTAYTPRMP